MADPNKNKVPPSITTLLICESIDGLDSNSETFTYHSLNKISGDNSKKFVIAWEALGLQDKDNVEVSFIIRDDNESIIDERSQKEGVSRRNKASGIFDVQFASNLEEGDYTLTLQVDELKSTIPFYVV